MLTKHANGSIATFTPSKSHPRRKRRRETKNSIDHPGHKHVAHSSDEEYGSDRTTSDEVELKEVSSDDEGTDDEEAGLTKTDGGKRKRRRKANTLLSERVVSTPSILKQDHSSADRSVIKALLINALLIASWYAFSLSISIVSLKPFKQQLQSLIQ